MAGKEDKPSANKMETRWAILFADRAERMASAEVSEQHTTTAF